MIPSVVLLMKVIPKGTEATMQAVSSSIHSLNMHLVRSQLGIQINSSFVNVTKENIGNYPMLTIIECACALIPLTYIYLLIPTIAETEKVHQEIIQDKETSPFRLVESERSSECCYSPHKHTELVIISAD